MQHHLPNLFELIEIAASRLTVPDPKPPRGGDAALYCEVIHHSKGLWQSMEGIWRELLAATGEPSPFLSCHWIGTWLEILGPQIRPVGLVWRTRDGPPVGCTLLSVGREWLGPFPIVRSYLNASGTSQAGCEHNDVLALPEFRSAVLDDLIRRVRAEAVDEFVLHGFREGAAEEVRARWPISSWIGHRSEAPYVALTDLRAANEPYLSTLSSNTRAQIRRSTRLYVERFGSQSVSVARTSQEATDWFAKMVELHASRWNERGEVGAFADKLGRLFHRRLLERSSTDFEGDELAVEMLRVRFGSEDIGFLYNLRNRGRVSFYQSGFKYQDDNRLKPGLVTHACAVDDALGRGQEEYDFLGGEPEPVRYKRSLSSGRRSLIWMRLQAPSRKMRAIESLRRMRHGLGFVNISRSG